MKQKNETKQIVIFKGRSGVIELRADIERETLWATQAQIASVFGVTPQNITMHLSNIYKQKELKEKGTCKESLQVQNERGRMVERRVKEYDLDAIIAVGYRINSIVGTRFRQWATKILREHIVKGYTINRARIAKNYEAFMKSVADIQALLPEHVTLDPKSILELVKEFSSTWLSLEAYDKDALAPIAESEPKKKEQMTALVTQLLR